MAARGRQNGETVPVVLNAMQCTLGPAAPKDSAEEAAVTRTQRHRIHVFWSLGDFKSILVCLDYK